MEHPHVQLVQFTPDAEKLVCAAAKLCYAPDPSTIFEHTPQEIESFLRPLRSMGHLSSFKHASYTFLLAGASRTLTHRLGRCPEGKMSYVRIEEMKRCYLAIQ